MEEAILLSNREVLFEKVRSENSEEDKLTSFLIKTFENCEIKQTEQKRNKRLQFKNGFYVYFELHQPFELRVNSEFWEELQEKFGGNDYRLEHNQLRAAIKKTMQKKLGIKNLIVMMGFKR